MAEKITKTRLARERIEIGGKSYRRFINYPANVFDDTVRCIGCGQIDEESWHDRDVCIQVRQFLDQQVRTTPNG